jgi:hypothetical protein
VRPEGASLSLPCKSASFLSQFTAADYGERRDMNLGWKGCRLGGMSTSNVIRGYILYALVLKAVGFLLLGVSWIL